MLCSLSQILEVCIISLVTSVISFGLPLLRRCSACPDSEMSPGIECPRPPGTDGNFVNVRFLSHFFYFFYYNIKYHYHIVVWPLNSGKYFFLSVVSINFIPLLNMQFYCAKDSEYNDLATIFFNTQVMLAEYNNSYYIKHFYGSWFLVFDIMTFLLQDDAIRNLFSAKTFHEYSAQSLVIFLVLYFITLFSLIYDIV